VIHHRSNVGTHDRSNLHLDDFKTLLFDLLLEITEDALLTFLKMLHQSLALILESLRLEDCGDVSHEILDQSFHVFTKPVPLGGRKRDEDRLIVITLPAADGNRFREDMEA